MRVLVVHGSKMGGTAGIAEMLAHQLEHRGLEVEVRPVAEAADALHGADAVIIGGSLYAGRWHKGTRRFVKRHGAELRARSVWMFASGPLDTSASSRELPPVHQMAKALTAAHARGHATFGGRLLADAPGFVASRVSKRKTGDFRDEVLVRVWADRIADELLGLSPAPDVGGAVAQKVAGA